LLVAVALTNGKPAGRPPGSVSRNGLESVTTLDADVTLPFTETDGSTR
jgi:hypothetical protein